MKDHGQQARASENFAGSVDFETPRPDLQVHFLNFQKPWLTGPGLLAVVFHKPWLAQAVGLLPSCFIHTSSRGGFSILSNQQTSDIAITSVNKYRVHFFTTSAETNQFH